MAFSTHNRNTSWLQKELQRLEAEPVLLDGMFVKPSQCYRVIAEPPHVLFNTNCPEQLMDKIELILLKYSFIDEAGA